MTPRSAPYRALAAMCYLLPVAVLMIILPSYREVRLLRIHAIQSMLLATLSVAGTVAIALSGTVLGRLPWVGMSVLMLTGLLICIWILLVVAYASAAAVAAYQGKSLRIPFVDRWVRHWNREMESRIPAATEPKRPGRVQ